MAQSEIHYMISCVSYSLLSFVLMFMMRDHLLRLKQYLDNFDNDLFMSQTKMTQFPDIQINFPR